MPTESERRRYWAEQMEAAARFMDRMVTYPVEECGEPLEPLAEAAADAGVEVEFSDQPLIATHRRIFRLRRGLIPGFVAVARAMNDRGWVLKIEDAFRTPKIQHSLAFQSQVFATVLRKAMWELDGRVPTVDFLFRRITAVCATRPKIGTHLSGSALDISVLNRDDHAELDRGGPYAEISELTPLASPFISEAARRNRREITRLVEAHGFMAYPYEFWHYSQGDAYAEHLLNSGHPGRYGPVEWNPADGSVTPIANPTRPLAPDTEIRQRIEAVLKGLPLG